MVFSEVEVRGIIATFHFYADVHPDDTVFRFLVEDKNLLELSHRMFLSLFIEATGTSLCDY